MYVSVCLIFAAVMTEFHLLVFFTHLCIQMPFARLLLLLSLAVHSCTTHETSPFIFEKERRKKRSSLRSLNVSSRCHEWIKMNCKSSIGMCAPSFWCTLQREKQTLYGIALTIKIRCNERRVVNWTTNYGN